MGFRGGSKFCERAREWFRSFVRSEKESEFSAECRAVGMMDDEPLVCLFLLFSLPAYQVPTHYNRNSANVSRASAPYAARERER